MTVIYLGGDISKGYVDAKLLNEAGSELAGSRRYDDTPAGHAALQEALLKVQARYPQGVSWEIGVEASGGLERNWLRFFTTFVGANGRVYRLNPLAVRRYRERELHQSVTDPASARDLALYLRSGRRRAEHPYEPQLEGSFVLYRVVCNQIDRSTQLQNELQTLLPSVHPDLVQYCRKGFPEWVLRVLARYPTSPSLSRASAVTLARIPYVTAGRATHLIAAAKASVAALRDPQTGRAVLTLAKEILRLEHEISQLKRELQQQLEDDRTVQLLVTIPGIGLWTAVQLRLELGHMDRFPTADAVVAFAGLDPSYHQSGDGNVTYAISKRGRKEIRAALYMSALTAIRFNPAIRAFYERLLAHGKRKDVALVACMAKLLRIAYACVISGQEFDGERHERVRARYEQARQAAQAAKPSAPAAVSPGLGSLQAPVSDREAKRRKAAAAPQKGGSPRVRGHGAARTHVNSETPHGATPGGRDLERTESGAKQLAGSA